MDTTTIGHLVRVVGLLFCPFAAVGAYLISYDEYSHHFPHRRKAVLMSLQAAFITLAIFVALSFVAGYLADQFFVP